MKETRRIVDSDDPWAAEIIGSALADEPPTKSRAALLSALAGVGYASTTAAATGAAGAAATSKVAAGAAVASKAAAGASVSVIVKWVGIATVGALVTTGVTLSQWPESSAPLSQHQSPLDTLRTRAAERVTEARTVNPENQVPAAQAPAPSGAPASQTPESSKVRTAASGSARDPQTTSLDDEIAHLDSARLALKSGNASGALIALDAHAKRFRGGALAPEAEVMRIEALTAAGNKGAAVARARSFLRTDSKSPHAARVRALLERIEP